MRIVGLSGRIAPQGAASLQQYQETAPEARFDAMASEPLVPRPLAEVGGATPKKNWRSDLPMCGFAGFLNNSRSHGDEALRDLVLRMADTLGHRGPDDRGAWTDAEAGIALGFRRLAILDLTPEGHQPMVSACGRYVTIFNGEIYNFRELRKELAGGPAPPFRGHSDTEVLLAAIARWGLLRAVERFVGMFAFAIWDRRARRLHLVRDRVGEKPLYYGWMGETFLFGSELKALRTHHDCRGEVDRAVLAAYAQLGYVPGPHCIYEGLSKLTPGTILTVDPSRPGQLPASEPYWNARQVAMAGLSDPFRGSDSEAIDHLDTLLRDAVARQMVADVPLGAFLSGGIDSSTIVAMMQAQSPRPVETFTIGFHEEGYDEAAHAKAVAAHLGTRHTELYVTSNEAMGVIPALPTLYDEPFSDASQIPTFLVSQLARKSVTVSLSGDGGDELFGGYARYLQLENIWKLLRRFPRATRKGLAATLQAVPLSAWDRLSRLLRPALLRRQLGQYVNGRRVHRFAHLMSHANSHFDIYTIMMRNGGLDSPVLQSDEPRTRFSEQSSWEIDGAIPSVMLLDLLTYLPDDILVKVDRASMGVSLESRAPLLDHRVVEFAWKLPMSMKVRRGQGKWLLRKVLDRYVPRELVERPKMGFGVPLAAWLRGPLRPWAEDLLGEDRLRREGYFDPAVLRRRWSEHLSGRRDWCSFLWTALMFQAWRETL